MIDTKQKDLQLSDALNYSNYWSEKASFLGASEVRKGPPLWKLGKLDQLLFFLWKRWQIIESKVL